MKILFILPRFPYPLEKGDKLRAYHQIKTLSVDNEVYLFAISHNRVEKAHIDELRKYCRDISVARVSKLFGAFRVLRNLFTVRSLQIGYWDSNKARKQYRSFESQVNPDVIYAQMVRTIKYAAHSSKPKVLDFQDALSMNQERRMLNYRGPRYFFHHYEFKMLRSAEYNACSIFDRLTVISEIDSRAIPQRKDTVIDIVRNGVDFDYFHSMDKPKCSDVVFCGNMQYKPNIDAARYLVNDIMPLVWTTHPTARVVIAGATPTAAVRQLASKRVEVTGSVDDIRDYYAQSRVFVAPMRIGSGLQNKLLEAMSMRVPCVTTPLANASIGAVDGTHILIGDNAAKIAQSITRLLDDEVFASSMADKAFDFVKGSFSWAVSGAELQSVLRQAIETHHADEEIELEDE